MDVFRSILADWIPAIHAGMTNAAFSFSVGERKIMNHFRGNETVPTLVTALPHYVLP